MSLLKNLGHMLFFWTAKMAAFGIVSLFLFTFGVLLILPGIGLVISAYTINWCLGTSFGMAFSDYVSTLFQKWVPLPPGPQATAEKDYGVRLSVNLKKLRESASVAADLGSSALNAQSKSVGGFLTESPLDMAERSGPPSPASDSPRNSLEESDSTASTPPHSPHVPRSRSLTLPVKSQLHNSESDSDVQGSTVANSSFRESPPRIVSHPIKITSASKAKLRGPNYPEYPLTDGAMAEFAALSSTPLQGSDFIL
jgi:hypothetical protein